MQNGVSFEMPAHEMCLERRAVLFRLDGQSEYLAFTDEFSFMPDVVHVNGRKFKYQGVSDGRGFYREIANPVFAEIARSHQEYFENSAVELDPFNRLWDLASLQTDCRVENGCGNQQTSAEEEAKRLVSTFDKRGISVCYHGIPHRYPCEDCDLNDLERAGSPNSSHTTPENANPIPDIPCSRCSEVLDLISKMIENPPGLSGIRSPLGHIGNQYVDAGWVEALTRVKWHLVTGGSGTREGI